MNRCGNLTDKQDYLSKRNCDCLKGIFAVCVLMHHLFQDCELFYDTLFGGGILFLGYFSVGIFFFLSGYGLMRSVQEKGPSYLEAFPRRRILPFYCMMLLMVIIYLPYRLILDHDIGVSLLIRSVLFGGTVVMNGWYLQVQLLYYILFYLIFRRNKNRFAAMTLIAVVTAVYAVLMVWAGYEPRWYVSNPLFVLGVWFACNKSRIDAFIDAGKNWMLSLLITGLVFAASIVGYKCFHIRYLSAACITLAESAFVAGVLLMVNRIRISYRITQMLGAISLEIYLMQAMCLSFFHSQYITIQNYFWYTVVATVSTMLLAVAIHPIIKKIFSLCGGNRGGSKQYETGKI